MSSLPNNIGAKGSFLTDKELRIALDHIFRRGTFDITCIRHSSYQLRLGDKITIYKRPEIDAEGSKYDEFLPLSWETDKDGKQYIDIWPKKRALLYTREKFQFPDDVLGFVFSRGLLFAKGLAPETTYADPGFHGEFYITVVNVNENVVRLYRDTFLARLFVFRLDKPVVEGYVPGKEKGIDQQLLEIPVKRMWTEEDLRNIKDSELLKEIRKGCSIGDLLNQMIRNQIRFRSRNRLWLIILTVTFVLFLIWPTLINLFVKFSKLEPPDWLRQQIVGGLIGFIFGSMPALVTWIWKKVTRKP